MANNYAEGTNNLGHSIGRHSGTETSNAKISRSPPGEEHGAKPAGSVQRKPKAEPATSSVSASDFDHAAYIPASRYHILATTFLPRRSTKRIAVTPQRTANRTTLAVATQYIASCPVGSRVLVLSNLTYLVSGASSSKRGPCKNADMWERLREASAARTVTFKFCNKFLDTATGEISPLPGEGFPLESAITGKTANARREKRMALKKEVNAINNKARALQRAAAKKQRLQRESDKLVADLAAKRREAQELRHERAMAKQINKRIAG